MHICLKNAEIGLPGREQEVLFLRLLLEPKENITYHSSS